MNVVTLWHHLPHPAQACLAEYLVRAEFPSGSNFVWALAPHCALALAATRDALESRGHTVSIHQFEPPRHALRGRGKHERVAWLYNRLMSDLRDDHTFFLEDDVIPCDLNASGRLRAVLDASPPAVACVGGAYRVRGRAHLACASISPRCFPFLPWSDLPNGPEPVYFLGCFTLYRTAALRASLPFRLMPASGPGRSCDGWDMNLAHAFHRLGLLSFLDASIRAEHRTPDVIEWCEKHGQSLG